ncbi:MAG: LysR family transcriptional regulator [Burkholderiales bacterium]|nr:LysR family transcriptional regulator [Burkholderiales bacterium]
MDLRGIRYFVQIAELGSITRAAQHLRVAQPALSRHIRALEEELGAPLLLRLPRGVRLTTAGRQFLDHCQRILRELDRAQDGLRSGGGAAQGRVILGVSPTTGPLLLPGVVERMRRQCPQISLKVVDGFSNQLYDWLQAGRADIAVLTNPVNSRSVAVTPLISEPIVVYAKAQARASRRFFTVAELARTPVVSTEAIRIIADEQLQRHRARVSVEAEIDAVEAIRRLVLRGTSIALMPVSTFHEDVAAGDITATPVADANIHRILTLGRQAERRASAAVDEVVQIMTAEVRALAEDGVFSLPGGAAEKTATRAPRPRKTRNQEQA